MKKILLIITVILITACTSTKPATKNMDKEEYYVLRGINLSYEGKYLEALQQLEMAYKKNSKNPITLRELGLVYGELGNLDKSEEFYKRALTEDPRDQVSLNNLARIKYVKGDLKGAEDYLAKISKDSIDGEVLKLRGFIAAQRGEYDEAYPYLRDAIMVENEHDVELYRVYSLVMIENKKFKELYQTLEDGYSKYGNNSSYVLAYTSLLSERFGEDDKSLRVLKRYMAENGGEDPIYMQIAKIGLSAGEVGTARKAVEMVSDRYKYDHEYLILKRDIMAETGNTAEVDRINKLIEQLS